MFGKYSLLRMMLALMFTLILTTKTFSQENTTLSDEEEKSAALMKEVTDMTLIFNDDLKRTKISEITKRSLSPEAKDLTLGEYFEYGIATAGGTAVNLTKALPGLESAKTKAVFLSSDIDKDIITYLSKKFEDFYKQIVPVLTKICKALKNSPVRLDGLSLDVAPFGMGGSLSIAVNYESPVFGEKQQKK